MTLTCRIRRDHALTGHNMKTVHCHFLLHFDPLLTPLSNASLYSHDKGQMCYVRSTEESTVQCLFQ